MHPHEDDYVAGNPRYAGSGRMIVVSGCSGGGKSTLLQEMGRRGYQVHPEPGRQVVKEQMLIGGDGVPWKNVERFVDLCVARAMYFFNTANPVEKAAIFDRSIVDNAAGLERIGLPVPPFLTNALERYRYARRVFMAPPWKELFANDAERRHSFQEAEAEYENLLEAYNKIGYETVVIPRLNVPDRADYLEALIGRDAG